MRWSAYRLKNGHAAEHTICSDAGYALLRLTANGRVTGRFIAFHVGISGARHVLGAYDSAEDAKAACEAHLAFGREMTA